jgi:hypothetical protein
VRILLYKGAMRNYQNLNNSEKTEAMGRKVLSLDGDDPEALVTTAEIIAEKLARRTSIGSALRRSHENGTEGADDGGH